MNLLEAYQSAEKIDLTHPLVENMPVWPGAPKYCHELIESYDRGDVAKFYKVEMGEHTGTHLDAPSHFVPPPRGWSIDKVPIEQFVCRMVVQSYPGLHREAVTARMIQAREAEEVELRKGDAVFFHFGWDLKWDTDVEGFYAGWPGLDASAAQYLVERGVSLVGCDCLSIDQSTSNELPAHRTLLGAGILIGENFANLGRVGPLATLVACPLPIVDGSGSTLRAIAVR